MIAIRVFVVVFLFVCLFVCLCVADNNRLRVLQSSVVAGERLSCGAAITHTLQFVVGVWMVYRVCTSLRWKMLIGHIVHCRSCISFFDAL